MTTPVVYIADLAEIIQLAVAPVFLLAGIAGFLAVMSGRLGRIIDRVRVVQDMQKEAPLQPRHSAELSILQRRATITNLSIGMCTTAGLLVCVLIVCLFVGGYWGFELSAFLVALFVFALCFLIVALLLFLREVQLATRTLRITR